MGELDASAPRDPASSARRGRWLPVLVLAAAGATVAWFATRQVRSIADRSRPYVRRRADPAHPVLIVNPASGSGKVAQLDLEAAARDAGVEVVHLRAGGDLGELARAAIEAGADAIGVAGGDGSLGQVAAVAVEHDVAFFCVPTGTRNHFALDLGLDRDDPLSALAALRGGDEVLIDHGRADDRVFVNNASFGLYARAVHRDEVDGGASGPVAAVIRDARSNDDRAAPIRFTTPTGDEVECTTVTLVSNNPYVFSGPPDYGRRLRLDRGTLGIATAAQGSDDSASATIETWEADRFVVRSDEPILAALDGEPVTFRSPLELTTHPRALRALVPAGTKPGVVPTTEALVTGLAALARLGGPDEQDPPGPRQD